MTLQHFKIHFKNRLSEIYFPTEIDSFFFLLIKEYLDYKRIDSVLKSDHKIPKDKHDLLETATKRLELEEPIQYILGKTTFYGYPLLVNKSTLIPRPETEELIVSILQDADPSRALHILDIGTGSGCISIALAKQLPKAIVSAMDVSDQAIKNAIKNASINHVNISFFKGDILQIEKLPKQYDIIVSNPPYVRESEKAIIKKNVLEYEPPQALFVKDSHPLVFYEKIAALAKTHLNKDGMLFFEINQYLSKETLDLLLKKGFQNIQLKKDLFKNDRIVKAII